MKTLLSLIISGALVVSGYSQTRNVLVGTNNAVVQPTNFWSVDASNARSGLGLGSAATNPASAFQPSSAVLSNLASSNAVNLTNLNASNITGTIAISNGGTASTTAGGAVSNLFTPNTPLVFTTNGQVLANTGTNVLTFTNTVNVASFTVKQGTNTYFYAADDVVESYVNFSVYESISFSGSNSALDTRINLGFSTDLNTLWTATNASNARSAVELGATNTPTFRRLVVDPNASGVLGLQYGANDSGIYNGATYNVLSLRVGGVNALTADTNGVTFANPATTRTNLGLGWSALTNTNTSGFNASLYGSNTNPVLVNTNGNVVSPTNFWEVAPIQTAVQDFTGIATSQTNNATNARNVYVYSLVTNVSAISNTIILPTNTSTFNGDEVCVIHKGTTNTTTVVRQAGSTNNLITLNRFDESVKFIRELGQWDFYHNISFVEPIQFSGTNASANAAASRTNLGIPLAALTNTNNATFQEAIFTTNAAPTNIANVNTVNFNTAISWMAVNIVTNGVTNTFQIPLFK